MSFFKDEKSNRARYEWDKVAKGLGVRINPSGSSVYVFKGYGLKGETRKGRYIWLTICSTDSMTMTQARELAGRMRTLAKMGADPRSLLIEVDSQQVLDSLNKPNRGKPLTLGEFGELYLKRHAKVWKKSWKKDQQHLEQMKPLHERPLSQITRSEIEGLHRQLSASSKFGGNRAIETLRMIFRCAIEWGYLPSHHRNPAVNIRMNKEISRDRFITKEERPILEAALEAYPDLRIRTALRMILLMGYRHQEVLKIRWDYIDENMTMIRLPDSKNGKPHIMPIPERLIADLKTLKALGNPFVFPGQFKSGLVKQSPIGHINRAWQRIRKQIGMEDVRIHDLRRTFASDCIRNGVDLYTISRLLNQGSMHVTSIYAKHDLEPLRNVLNKNAESIATKSTGNVVPLRDWREKEYGQ